MSYIILLFVFVLIAVCVYFKEIRYFKKIMKEMEEINKDLLESIEKEKQFVNKE